MGTSGEGEATATVTTSGAGGKFRKIPFSRGHRLITPYDRPPASARGIIRHNNGSNNSGSLFAKLVVDPASKLINYGAHRFFASVFRKRLPPAPPQPTEVNGDLIDEPHEVVSNDQSGAQKSEDGEFTQLLNSFSVSGISELEQVLKQKTFSRYEVDHLIELLQSRAVESSFRVESQTTEKVVSDSGRHPITSDPLEEKIDEGDKSQGVVSTPIINYRVIEDDLASPAELAKAYMGSRPSKVSPSMLGTQSLTENGFVTPKTRGRVAIYSMVHTPSSRIHPHSIQKGIRSTNIGNAGPSMSSYHLLVEQNERFESKSLALKRKNSVLDDDLGSLGPFRRIRQKPNLLPSKTSVTASGVEIGSDSVRVSSKQKLRLIVKPKNSVSKTVRENQDDSNPTASYTHVPSRSSEVAARILQHLEKLTPKEKSPESKLVKLWDKSPLRLTSSILCGQAVKLKEDNVSSQLLQDGQKMEDTSAAAKKDVVESLKAPGTDSEAVHSIVKNRVAQPSLEERAFRMTAQVDDGVNCYEIASGPLAKGNIPNDIPFVDNDVSVTKEPILLNANNQPKAVTPSGHVSNKTIESGTLGRHMIELGNGGTVFPPLSAAIHSDINLHSVDFFGKLKGTEYLPPSSHFSLRTADKFPPLASGSSNRMTVLKSENSSSLVNVLPSATGSQSVIPKSDQGGLPHPLEAGDANGKSHTVPSIALNGPLVLSSPAVSSTAISSYDANKLSTASSSLFNPLTSIASFGYNGNGGSTSAAISGNLFGSNVAPSVLGGPVATFGAFVDPTTTVSEAALTANDSALVDLTTKAEKEPNFVCSSGKHSDVASSATFGASSATFAPKSANSSFFYSTMGSSSHIFSVGATSPAMSSLPPNITQPTFGSGPSSSAASPGSDDQMNTDDSMAEDPVQYSDPSVPVFGQQAVSPSPSGFMFGSTAASSVNPFSFGGQQNQVTPQNPSPFQGSGGSFSLGSGGGDKSTRKFIKANRNKNRKK